MSEVIHVGGMEVRTFEVMHGKNPVTGIRVNDFAFITDVNHIPPTSIEILQGLDTLVIDSVRHAPHPNHYHFDATMAVIEELQPRRAFLTHLSHEFDHNTYEQGLPDHVRLAYDGLRINF
jgi:phosphoribosyl 1,2-cyclic phosphate phosphodiesterase